MKNGKLIWKDLTITEAVWIKGHGYIDIDIPMELYIPFDSTSSVPWLIRSAIYNHLLKLKWPVENLDCLYFLYYPDRYHLQIVTDNTSTFGFYTAKQLTDDFDKTNF